MRILWHSNAPWCGTGYGQQTAAFLPLLREQGHDIAVSAFYGLQGAPMTWEGFTCYPGGAEPYGNDVLSSHALHWLGGNAAAGAIILLCDAWVITTPSLRFFTVGAWVPVDHDPVPPAVAAFFQRNPAAVPIAMSRYGETKFREAGLDPRYVPHGVDCRLFRPDVCDRADARQLLQLPEDAYVVGMVAANKGSHPPRKSFPQMFDAFARFAARHTDALLYLHSEQMGAHAGIDLQQLADVYGIGRKVHFVDQYALRLGIPTEAMPTVYRAFDVLANPAMGEGFGVPIIEAQACGVPVIATDFSAMSELVGAGWKVEHDRWWDPAQAAWLAYPQPGSILDALEAAYDQRGNKTLGKRAAAFARGYDTRRIARIEWPACLSTLEGRLAANAQPADLAGDLAATFAEAAP